MLNTQFDSALARCFGCITAVVLSLSLVGCEQPQATPTAPIQATPSTATDYYFLNGQAATKLIVESLDAKRIVRIDVLHGQQAIDYARDAGARSAVLVQTK